MARMLRSDILWAKLNPVMEPMGVQMENDAIATVVGAIIAATFGIMGAWLTVSTQRRLEDARWNREREAARSALLSEAIRQLTVTIAAALHSMAWLGWAARYSDTFSRQNVRNYDAELHRLLPQVFGNIAVVATIDADVYPALRAIVDELATLDARLGSASTAPDDELASAIGNFHEEATRLERDLPLRIGSAIKRSL